MSFVYGIKKQLLEIGIEFENKFHKKAQTAPVPVQLKSVALKLLSNLENSLEDIFTKDLKDLRSFINYCLDKKVERDGKRIVYRHQNEGINAIVGAEFNALPNEVKAEYAPYPPGEESYMVHKTGLTRMIRELQQEATTSNNKVAEVMLGKLIEEANRDLNLGIKKVPETEAAGDSSVPVEKPVPDGKGTGQSNQQGLGPGSGTVSTKGEMAEAIKSALSGVYPLSNVLDLIIIKRFFEVVRDWSNSPQYQARFNQMLSTEIGAPIDSPLLAQKKETIEQIGRDGLRYADDLLRLVAKSRIQVQDVEGSAGMNPVDTFKTNVLKDTNRNPQTVKNVADAIAMLVNRVYALEEEIIKNDSFITEQQQIAQSWTARLGRLQNFASIAANAQPGPK